MKPPMARWAVMALAAAAAAALAAVLLRGGKAAELPCRESPAFRCVRAVTVYAALVERPVASSVRLVGDLAWNYRNLFEHAGLVCVSNANDGADIVFAAGELSKDERNALRKALSSGAMLAECIDARELSASDFKARLESMPGEEVHLWMPGEKDWLMVGRMDGQKPRLDDMMDVFSRESAFDDMAEAQCNSLPGVFASYAGTREAVLPAFNGKDALVRPEDFVTREPAPLDWIDASGVDADIRDAALREMRSMQIVRRIVLVGDLKAAKGDEEKSAEAWAKAALRNPGDTMLVERLERLLVNARTFEKLGKAAMAARCYDTMAQIRPDDPFPVSRYAACMRLLGKTELCSLAEKRAKELEERRLKALDSQRP